MEYKTKNVLKTKKKVPGAAATLRKFPSSGTTDGKMTPVICPRKWCSKQSVRKTSTCMLRATHRKIQCPWRQLRPPCGRRINAAQKNYIIVALQEVGIEDKERHFLWCRPIRRRISKGCLGLVEGPWFGGMGELSEISRATDDVTCRLFELLREEAPQLDAGWGTTSVRVKTALPSTSENQTSLWERLFTAALEETEDRNAYMSYLAGARRADAVVPCPIGDPTGDPGQPVPGTELREAGGNKKHLISSCCQS